MDATVELPDGASADTIDAVLVAERFLTTIFAPTDLILYRPIESWIERGKKCSETDYKNTLYRHADPLLIRTTMLRLTGAAAEGHLNLFFGVCPRFGAKGRFDLAWQMRTVRCLWVDIDHTSVDEARERVAKAGLPDPSITVGSGNGAHLYWLLDAPYLIDDVGGPLPVETEWIPTPGGRKKPRKYIVEEGERVYLDGKHHVSRLSPRAESVQDIIAGLAQAVGGDHTQDLTRLLRIPGPPNRKNGRNGQEPVPTSLIECEPDRRYSFETFERFKVASPESAKRKQIDAMPLPATRKLKGNKEDKLAERIAASSIAPAGSRSEADFALCCFAIRNGIGKEEIWSKVENIGKFLDGGRRYFDVTWGNAEYQVRADLHEKLTYISPPPKVSRPLDPAIQDHDAPEGTSSIDRPTIHIDAANMPVGDTMHRITDCLIEAKDCFMRCEQLVVVHGDTITAVLTPMELAGLLNQHVEFFYVDEEGGEYRPLTSAYAGTWLNQRVERSRMPQITLFTRNPVFTVDWRLLSPGYDQQSGIYYAGPIVEAREGTTHLDTLLQDFCFKAPSDRTNYISILLTAILIPHFIGGKPGVVFNGNQPGLGKTILAQIISILRDGRPTETASFNPNDEEFEKRLGSIVRRGVTTIIIDNAKGQGRKPRIESACLERSVTDPVLSFRLLGKSQEIRAENSHTFCITANTPDIGPDLSARSVFINLEHEGDPRRRRFRVANPQGYALEHRGELLGELIGMVERWRKAGMPKAAEVTRFTTMGWDRTIGGVLQANGEPDFLANAEESAAQLDQTRREFAELVGILLDHQQGNWSPTELAEICRREGLLAADLGEGSARSLSTKMGTLAGRYINERFGMPDGRQVQLIREKDRKGHLYRVVALEGVPNLEGVAEPMPNLDNLAGSAP